MFLESIFHRYDTSYPNCILRWTPPLSYLYFFLELYHYIIKKTNFRAGVSRVTPTYTPTGAPLGSLVGSHLHRLVLASFIYITDSVQFIGALIIVKPWTNETTDTPL